MARVHVGLPSLRGKLARYAERFDLLEVHPLGHATPKGKGALRKWRDAVPPGFVFSVVLPQAVGTLQPSAEFDEALDRSLKVATTLEARCMVLATPASVRPTVENRKRVMELAERLPQDGQLIAWHPSGMWERHDVIDIATRSGLLPVFDAACEELAEGALVYTRIRALGASMSIGADRIDRVASQLATRREAFVVADSEIAGKVRSGLAATLPRHASAGSAAMVFTPNTPLADDDEEQ
jgi:hypothetical protein